MESGTTEDLSGVFFLDARNGWAVGNNLITRTDNAGATWAQQETALSGDTLRGIHLTGLESGLAAGSGGHIWKYGR